VVGNGQRGFEGGCCEFPGAHAFSKLKCGLDLSDFGGAEAWDLPQILDMGAIKTPKTPEIA
jgi:hypothetical protein